MYILERCIQHKNPDLAKIINFLFKLIKYLLKGWGSVVDITLRATSMQNFVSFDKELT